MRVFVGELRSTVDRLAFGPGQRLVAACAGRDRIDLWDAVTGTHADSWQAARREVLGLGMLPDGRAVVAVDRQPLQVIDPNPYRKFSETFPTTYGNADAVAVAADSPVLVTIQHRRGGQLTVWQPGPDGRYAVAWTRVCGAHPVGLAVADDGALIAVANADSVSHAPCIVIRAVETGVERVRLATPGWRYRGRLLFLPDGRRVAALYDDRVTVWDHTPRARGAEFAVGRQPTDLTAHPDSCHLLTAGADGVVRVWDPDSGTEVRAYHWDVGRLGSVAVSRDGLLAAAGGEDGRVVVWDVDL